MKPDKHKQKRTQQYKKKHGIKDDNDAKSEKADDKSRPKKGRAPAHAPAQSGVAEARPRQGTSRGVPTKSRDVRDMRGQDHGQGSGSDEECSSFKRREVKSNWEKYVEIDDLPEAEERRGEDFRALLDAAGTAISQFRFADEKLWEEEEAVLGGVTTEIGSLLSIDTNELAAALDCVPLHRILGIEEAAFSPEEIELFNQEADMNQKLFIEARKQRDDEEKDPDGAKFKVKENMEGLEKIWNQPEGSILDELAQDLEEATKTTNPLSVSHHGNRNSAGSPAQAKGDSCVADCPLNANQIEDDLDRLLDFEDSEEKQHIGQSTVSDDSDSCDPSANVPVEQSPTEKVEMSNESLEEKTPAPKNSEQKTVSMANLEDELDKLLDLEDNAVHVKNDQIKTTENKSDDLEDWLDSMLDD